MTCYATRWVHIDLGSGVVREESLSEDDVTQWFLGSGWAARRFYAEMDPRRDPLDPANPLLIFIGLLTGTYAPAASRSSWCGRSPLTGIWNESNAGGHWGAMLRAAGLAGLVITGKAASPVYLWVHDSKVEVRSADHLWGLGTFATHNHLREETMQRAEVAAIGPAGENRVPIAGVMIGGQGHNRAAGRGGIGALMGSKGLKAIVVCGEEKPTYADPEGFRTTVRRLNKLIRSRSEGLSLTGTAGGVPATELYGDLPLKNWREGSWPDGAQAISGQTIRQTIWTQDTRCFACPIGCGKAIEVREGPYAGTWGEGPEYETLAGFGGNLLISDLPALAAINARCNDLGLDTISTSGVIAFATEAMERGLVTPDDADGLTLDWGAPEPVLALLPQIAHRQGIGDLLADGVRAAAQRLGREAESFAIHVKGLEVPYHDPRGFVDMALNYATSSRGACHLESLSYWRGYGVEWPGWEDGPRDRFASDEATVRLVVKFQDYMATYNPLGLCKFIAKGGITPHHIAALLSAALGKIWSAEDVMQVGRRIFDLKRLINLRLGITTADDTLPVRFLTMPRPTGGAAGVLPDLEAMLPRYYALRGWDEQGCPIREPLE